MAKLSVIRLSPFACQSVDDQIIWQPQAVAEARLPQIFLSNGEPWGEPNLWLFGRHETGSKPSTLISNAEALVAYASWLETVGAHWLEFPLRKRDRCLVRYRRHLVEALDEGTIASSTASARMRVLIAFYRWVVERRVANLVAVPWTDRTLSLSAPDQTGLRRTFQVTSSDLSLPNRGRKGIVLEDGAEPLDPDKLVELLFLSGRHATPELHYMLMLGATTGMRLGTICDLKLGTLQRAIPDPLSKDMFRLVVGPQAHPPVATKFGVTGNILIPGRILDELIAYAQGSRRAHRGPVGYESPVFLSRFGAPYRSTRGGDRSRAVNLAMLRFRNLAKKDAPWITGLKFHQTRATYATMVAAHALKVMDPMAAIGLVRDLLLHKDEATSLKYIKFVQRSGVKSVLADEFTRIFFSIAEGRVSGAT